MVARATDDSSSERSSERFAEASRASRLTPRRVATSLIGRVYKRTQSWAHRRHGLDSDPFVIPARRVYILPTRLGLFFAGMLFLMFLGSMNYANNLALGLTFILGSVALVTMHHCQRNLAGLQVMSAATEPVFAGQMAQIEIALESSTPTTRHELVVTSDHFMSAPVTVARGMRSVVRVAHPAVRRGRLVLGHVQLSSNFPFGLFRAWTHVHIPLTCIVYPKPADRADPPRQTETDIGGAHDAQSGGDDFSGFRSFQPGDSPRHIAWKSYARGLELQVKQYSGTAVTSHVLDWDSMPGLNTEARLSCLARWIEDAHKAGRAFGLRMPGENIPPNMGTAHRHRCLNLLALFGEGHVDPSA